MASQLLYCTIVSLTIADHCVFIASLPASMTMTGHCQSANVSALPPCWSHVAAYGDPCVNLIHQNAVSKTSVLKTSMSSAHGAAPQSAWSWLSTTLPTESHQSLCDFWHPYSLQRQSAPPIHRWLLVRKTAKKECCPCCPPAPSRHHDPTILAPIWLVRNLYRCQRLPGAGTSFRMAASQWLYCS